MSTLQWVRFVAKPLVFSAALVPFAWIVAVTLGWAGNGLGANPVEALLDHFGNWGIRFVMIALAVTPLRKLSGWNWLTRFRRMLGLFAAFYVTLHLTVYLVLDQGLALMPILEDVAKRPYITIGVAAWLLLAAMAVTSFTALRRRMGQRWQQLHYSVYAVGVLAVWHYWWQVKKDITEPLIYALILTTLLGLRAFWRWQRISRRSKPASRPAARGLQAQR
ncbi:MAG: protein-methionine-sulfoxide reductase heme-binding subunit MsrQ [Pseudomonadota bacterium]